MKSDGVKGSVMEESTQICENTVCSDWIEPVWWLAVRSLFGSMRRSAKGRRAVTAQRIRRMNGNRMTQMEIPF